MSNFVVIKFASKAKAEEVSLKLLNFHQTNVIEIEDAVVALKRANARIKLSQVFPAGTGAAKGSIWTLLPFMVRVAASAPPEGGALFILIRKMATDTVLADLEIASGRVWKTFLDRGRRQVMGEATEATNGSMWS